MDRNIIVVLVSAQTIQNVLFIKEFLKENDEVLLISTEKMRKQSEWIEKSLNIENQFHTVVVDEFDNANIKKKLEEFDFENYQNQIINITGGTKLMSLETYDFFKNRGNCDIYYITKGSEYKKIFPHKKENAFNFKKSVSIQEYFKAYGFNSKVSNPSGIDKEYTYKFFNWFVEDKNYKNQLIIKELQMKRNSDNNLRRTKKLEVNKIDNLKSFLYEINFPNQTEFLSLKEIEYLTGNWFEEYIFHTLRDANVISEGDILCGVSKRGDNNVENEFDVIFLKDNQLHIVECKTSIISQEKPSLPNDTIYKLDALQKELGLFAKSYIAVLNKESDLKPSHKERAKQYGITFLTVEDMGENLIKKVLK